MWLCNAFSLNMLSELPVRLLVQEVSVGVVQSFVDGDRLTSAVGHENTAALFSAVLERDIPANRTNVQLVPGDWVVVGQYVGPRLEPGATELPEGARIRWLQVFVEEAA